MELGQDVAEVLLGDFVSETAMSFAGGKVGHFFGGYLSRVNGSLRTAVFGENKEAIARLAKNMAALKAAAQNDAWSMTFLKSTGRGSFNQPVFVGATVGSEEVMKQAAKDLSLQINKDDKTTAFLAIVVTSAVFRGIKPTYRAPKLAAAGEGVVSRNGVNEPDLRLSYEGTPLEVDAYMKGAKQRNSLIETTPDGFIETTANGARIEWSKRSSVARETATVELTEKPIAKIGHNGRATAEVSLGDPSAIRAQMREMYKPIEAKSAEVAKLEADFVKRDSTYETQLRDLPATGAGASQARALTAHRAEARREYDTNRAKVEEDLIRTQRQVEGSDRHKSLVLALSVAQGVFPTGEYQLRVPGQAKTVLLTVGYMQPLPGAKGNPRHPSDTDVPIKHVNELLKLVESVGVVPESICIMHREGLGWDGSLWTRGQFYQINVNTATTQPLRFIYNHESGHLFDYTRFQKLASADLQSAVLDAYKAGLETGKPAKSAAKAAEVDYNESFRAEFDKYMLDPANRSFQFFRVNGVVTADALQQPATRAKYYASRNELIAEMFKMYQEQKSITGSGGKPLTYDQLLDCCVKPRFPFRANVMRGFGKMYDVLATEVFPTVEPVNSNAAKPAPNSPVEPAKKEGAIGLPPATKP